MVELEKFLEEKDIIGFKWVIYMCMKYEVSIHSLSQVENSILAI